jgi:hypothetical protein
MTAPHPFFSFFPALPLEKTASLGDWNVGVPPADVTWCSPRFRELAEKLLASFHELKFKDGALLWHRERGFDGSRPSDKEIGAIRAAVGFAAFDANDRLFGHRGVNPGDYLVTTENTDLFIQPIDEGGEGITHLRDGFLRNVLIGGWKIGEKPLPVPDAVMPLSKRVPASTKLAKTLFDKLIAHVSKTPARISTAIGWHRAAMVNTPAVNLEQRIVALKTGFEALFGESESSLCATALRSLFENATARHRDLLPWAGMIWSPKDRTDLQRSYKTRSGKKKQVTRSEVEDWFMALADARNSVIHDGALPAPKYAAPPERPLSRYAGWLFWVGERLLREAVKAILGPEILLCGAIAERAAFDEIYEKLRVTEVQDSGSSRPNAPEVGVAPDTSRAARDLPTLLKELGCHAANQVVLGVAAVPARSSSLDAATEMAAAAHDLWKATAGDISISINTAEREVLEQAGAEEELREYVRLCE